MTDDTAWCRERRDGPRWEVSVGGSCTLAAAARLQAALGGLKPPPTTAASLDLAGVSALDTAGAWVLHRFVLRLQRTGIAVALGGATPAQRALLDRMAIADRRPPLRRPFNPIRDMVERAGEATFRFLAGAHALISFIGMTFVTAGRAAIRPSRMRWIPVLAHVERVGLDALPIVGLLSFLIGVVLAFQGADQLRQFGADIYTVNLLGVSVLREIGVLLVAILVAGRSGSAFTAEIGMMKANEEVDAMLALGLDPMEVLVIPRVVAMLIALPLLAFYGDVMALMGGVVMSHFVLDITAGQFMEQLQTAIDFSTVMVGLVKAPVFAFLIAMVGCYEGLQVTGSAESVGRLTTKSVVEAIFLVIVFDAAFSVLFSYLGV